MHLRDVAFLLIGAGFFALSYSAGYLQATTNTMKVIQAHGGAFDVGGAVAVFGVSDVDLFWLKSGPLVGIFVGVILLVVGLVAMIPGRKH